MKVNSIVKCRFCKKNIDIDSIGSDENGEKGWLYFYVFPCECMIDRRASDIEEKRKVLEKRRMDLQAELDELILERDEILRSHPRKEQAAE